MPSSPSSWTRTSESVSSGPICDIISVYPGPKSGLKGNSLGKLNLVNLEPVFIGALDASENELTLKVAKEDSKLIISILQFDSLTRSALGLRYFVEQQIK